MRYCLVASLLCCIFFPGAIPLSLATQIGTPTQPQQTTTDDTLFNKGVESLKKGDLKEAEKHFKESLRQRPNHIGALLGLAEVYNRQGNLKEAEKMLQQALSQSPDSAEVQRSWGRYLYIQKRFQESESALKRAVNLDPKNVTILMDLGDLYMQGLNNPKQAIEIYRSVLAIKPDHAGARYALGTALAQTGEPAGALKELEEAARLSPSNPLPLQALGNLHFSQKKYDKALDYYARALKVRPDFFMAHMARGEAFLAKGEKQNALAEFNSALKLNPRYAPAQLMIGTIHQGSRRLNEAEEAYRAAIKLDPKSATAYNNLAWLEAEQKKKLDEALTWAKKAVELAPKVPQFQDTLGYVHLVRGEPDEAISVLMKAADLDPQGAEIQYHLGLAYAEKGKRTEAIAAFKKALSLKKDFTGAPDARRKLAELERR